MYNPQDFLSHKKEEQKRSSHTRKEKPNNQSCYRCAAEVDRQ